MVTVVTYRRCYCYHGYSVTLAPLLTSILEVCYITKYHDLPLATLFGQENAIYAQIW